MNNAIGVWHVWGKSEMRKGFCTKTMKERGNLEYLDGDVRILSEWILKKKPLGGRRLGWSGSEYEASGEFL